MARRPRRSLGGFWVLNPDRTVRYIGFPATAGDYAALREWSEQMEGRNKVVSQAFVEPWWVSTVFLGIDHGFSAGETPTLFETMVFWRPRGTSPDREHTPSWVKSHPWFDWMDRYKTWDEAETGHREVVEKLKAGRGPDGEPLKNPSAPERRGPHRSPRRSRSRRGRAPGR